MLCSNTLTYQFW